MLVPFPFTDLSSVKQRPALVVSPGEWNAIQSDVVLVAITSQVPPSLSPGEILLAGPDLDHAGLPKTSVVRTTKIFTMHQGLLRRTLGHLPDPAIFSVLSALRSFLG